MTPLRPSGFGGLARLIVGFLETACLIAFWASILFIGGFVL